MNNRTNVNPSCHKFQMCVMSKNMEDFTLKAENAVATPTDTSPFQPLSVEPSAEL